VRYWYDFEFVERGPHYPIVPVSLGMVSEDDRELYLQFTDGLMIAMEHPWVRENVVPKLTHLIVGSGALYPIPQVVSRADGPSPWVSQQEAQDRLLEFCDPNKYGKPEFWGYYCAYDHVLLSQIFGVMVNLPKGWPMYTLDIKQVQKLRSVISEQDIIWPESDPENEHNALADAREIRMRWDLLFPHGISGASLV
jgi:hypothetical protein